MVRPRADGVPVRAQRSGPVGTPAPTDNADHVGRGLLDALSVMRAPRSSRATEYAARPVKNMRLIYIHFNISPPTCDIIAAKRLLYILFAPFFSSLAGQPKKMAHDTASAAPLRHHKPNIPKAVLSQCDKGGWSP